MNNEFKSPEILELLKKKLSNKNQLMVDIAETMRTAVLKNFETEGSRIGKPWQKLSKDTIKQRQKKGYWPGKILQRTGQLKRSIISSYGEDYAQVSTNLIYAAIQNYGGIIHRSLLKTYLRKKTESKSAQKPKQNKMSSIRIPARPFMLLNEQDLEKIKKKIINSLTGDE
ncbi:Mu-like prophage protein GPG [Ignavibacterium album JCM 16511]|uniref:Mu-like prophage protein GPG n=1 Tax=Ignavibacterium album (strain DSM 19864 / JCM 16511 / NBRC 101810 / Mat9-16) TaxID=945713 RepID=I0AP42_IGNAJ|nr:phage virion morphogenesis protein [Ignavibacterium album]AFH50749.1 Mu-like prophage protein GPG [Ignavibacterium album JCM 16511]